MTRILRGRMAASPAAMPGWWLAVCATAAMVVVAIVAVSSRWGSGVLLEPLLAVPVALAGIGASAPRLPLGFGTAMLAAVLMLAPFTRAPLPWITTLASVVVVTAISAIGARLSTRGEQEPASMTPVAEKLANVTSVAEVVQRALLRPLPPRVGPLELQVVYLSAAAEARVGGDLYEIARTPFGIRLIVGDAQGKGLDAVEIAADVLGVFREVAHEVYTLAEVAHRLDAGLTRRLAASQAPAGQSYEEFVTAVLTEIDPSTGTLTIYSCGHPPPILLSRGMPDGRWGNRPRKRRPGPSATTVDVPSPAPPLRLLSLGDCSGAGRTLPFPSGDALLLYTDA